MPTMPAMSVMPGEGARAIVPYLVAGTALVLFLRRQFDVRDLLLLAGVGYVLYSHYRATHVAAIEEDAVERETVRAAVPTTLPAKSALALASHTGLSPHLATLQRRFGENSVLREAMGFLARFVDYYQQFSHDGRRYQLSELQQIDWTMRMAVNALLSLDLQLPDPRPYRRGVLHARKRPRWLHRAAGKVEEILRGMFAEIFDASGVNPEHFEVAPSNSWEEPYADRWKLT